MNSIRTILVFAKINIKRFFRDKTALFFTVLFPLIFLFIFGGLFGGNKSITFRIALINQSNFPLSKEVVSALKTSKTFKISGSATNLSSAQLEMERGSIDATILLPPNFGKPVNSIPSGKIEVLYDQNSAQAAQTLTSVLQAMVLHMGNISISQPVTVVSKATNTQGLSQFDYTFSGLLGFTIIGLGIFGPTNVFPELKKQGVLRRLHITPLRVWEYFLSNIISQAVVGIVSVVVMFIVATTVFHFHMRGSYFDLAVIILLGIFTIFGIGLAVGGWAKNQNQAAPLANIIVFPLMFLTGVFFPTYLMPQWLQNISTYLPLTPIINSIRLISTENKTLFDLGPQIALIIGWAVVIYAAAFKFFRWE